MNCSTVSLFWFLPLVYLTTDVQVVIFCFTTGVPRVIQWLLQLVVSRCRFLLYECLELKMKNNNSKDHLLNSYG